MTKVPSSRATSRVRLSGFDLACAAAAPALAIMVRDESIFLREEGAGLVYCMIALAVSMPVLVRFRMGSDLTRFFSAEDAVRAAKVGLAVAVLTAAIAFSMTRLDGVPRSLPAMHGLVLVALLVGGRVARRLVYVSQEAHKAAGTGAPTTNVLVVGADELASLYLRLVRDAGRGRIRIAGLLDLDGQKAGRTLGGRTVLGSVAIAEELIDELAVHGVKVDRIVVATDAIGPGDTRFDRLASIARCRGIALEHLPAVLGVPAGECLVPVRHVEPRTSTPVARPLYFAMRRLTDILVSLCALFVFSPVILAVAVIVRIAFGSPVVFWQERLGRYGRPIYVHKFRSMLHPCGPDGRPLPSALRETRLGRVLRALRLDELPQLVDVLKGDLSLIGPRPLLPVDQPADPTERLSVRPGITGWAQVHGGKAITPEEKNALDVWYIRNAGPLLDLRILWLTLRTVVRAGDRRDESAIRAAAAAMAMLEAERTVRVEAAE